MQTHELAVNEHNEFEKESLLMMKKYELIISSF